MSFLHGKRGFIGLYISQDKLGHDITIGANPVMIMYPRKNNSIWKEIEVYL